MEIFWPLGNERIHLNLFLKVPLWNLSYEFFKIGEEIKEKKNSLKNCT